MTFNLKWMKYNKSKTNIAHKKEEVHLTFYTGKPYIPFSPY